MSEILNIGDCVLESAIITTYDGREIDATNLVTAYSIGESIDAVAFNVTLRMLDAIGLLENTPLMGEETLVMKIRGLDYDTVKIMRLFIHKIDNVTPMKNDGGLSYNLHCLSEGSFIASTRLITTYFDKPINQIVKDLFEENFETTSGTPEDDSNADIFTITNGRTLVVERTHGDYRCIIPTFRPAESMFFLATRSYSTASKSCSFRFFETVNGYYFCTDEFLIRNAISKKKVKDVSWSSKISITPENIEYQKMKLEQFTNSNRADTASDIFSGGYASNVAIVDFVKKELEEYKFSYLTDSLFTGTDGTTQKNSRHSEKFITDYMNETTEKKLILFRDYDVESPGQLRGEQYIPEIATRRISYMHMINSTSMNAQIVGRIDISAGDVLNVSIKEMNASDERVENSQLSGNYIVHSVMHDVEGKSLTTSMRLIKFGWEKNYV